ncbi:MAG: penicillin acylase family protein, partial [Acidimicrobiia bacterium]
LGSNRKVAWAFTNSYGDLLDLIELEGDRARPDRFKSERGLETIHTHLETIAVKGEADVKLEVEDTVYGPVQSAGSSRYAVHWVALHPDAINLGLLALETAQDLDTALRVAARAGIPAQNITVADSSGRIGWTIAGALPRRSGSTDGAYPYRSTEARIWQNLRLPTEYPQIVNPPAGAIWTANNRVLGLMAPKAIGDGGADLGARVQQIRDGLASTPVVDESQLYRLALDDRALFAALWRDRALQSLTAEAVAGKPQRAEFRRLLKDSWTGRASPDSVGYRLARGYLYSLYQQLFGAVDAELVKLPGKPDFMLASSRWPAVVLRLVTERPAAWLPKGQTWEQLELAAIDDAISQLTRDGRALRDARWGELNRASIAHPLAEVLPVLGRWLSAPATPLAGDDHMPLISAPDFGQSERFVVSPGKEAHGLFNMPGGQSGHPLSHYFLADHQSWLDGTPRPLMPQAERHRLTFLPSRP